MTPVADRVQWLWTWCGNCFGYRDGDDLWTYDGRHVGRFHGQRAFSSDGRYLCELRNDNHLITKRTKGHPTRPRFELLPSRAARPPYVSFGGVLPMPRDYKDFPAPEALP